MTEKTVRVYDGIKYKDVTYSEIEDANGNPTGRYATVKEEEVTVLGTYLDIQEHYDQLKTDIEKLSKHKQTENGIYLNNYVGLLTDKKERIFLFSRRLRDSANATGVKSWFDWVISVLQNIGYVNDSYYAEKDSIGNIISIEFTITLKDGSDRFKMYLLPMDDYSYTLSEEK